jgi:hypothetical protein
LYPSHNCPPVALGAIDLTNAIGLRVKHFYLIHFFCHFSLFLMNIKTMKTSITHRFTEGVRLNSGFAKKRVQWLIEHSTSHQLLWYVDSLVLRNPLLRKAPNR